MFVSDQDFFLPLSPDTWMIIHFALQLLLIRIQCVYVWHDDNIPYIMFTTILNAVAQKVCLLKPLHIVTPKHS